MNLHCCENLKSFGLYGFSIYAAINNVVFSLILWLKKLPVQTEKHELYKNKQHAI
jgi:hypothetical protein